MRKFPPRYRVYSTRLVRVVLIGWIRAFALWLALRAYHLFPLRPILHYLDLYTCVIAISSHRDKIPIPNTIGELLARDSCKRRDWLLLSRSRERNPRALRDNAVFRSFSAFVVFLRACFYVLYHDAVIVNEELVCKKGR